MIRCILRILAKFACVQNLFKRDYILLVDNLFNNDAELVDNYALFEYLQTIDKYKNKSFYIVNKNNVQYEEIKNKYKNIISVDKTKINFALIKYLFKTKYWLDSFQVINQFNVNLKEYIKKSNIIPIYMQHGINYFKSGFWMSPYAKQIGDKVFKKIVFSSKKERNLFKEFYGYNDKNTILAGLSRWDTILNKPSGLDGNKTIFVYFTHRAYFHHPEIKIELTRYYQNIISFLNSNKLKEILKNYNITLKLGLHHEVARYCDFTIPNIEIIEDKDIGEIKQQAAMLITDFSSMCFDFMFNDKPIAFYRIDANDSLFAIDSEGRINNENVESKNGELYNICYDAESIINIIEKYCKNNFQLEEEYKQINNTFFTYRKDIRKHLIENILSSPENIPNGCAQIPSKTVEYNKLYNCREIIPFAFYGAFLSQKRGRQINEIETKIWFKTNEYKKAILDIELNTSFNKRFKWEEIEVFLNKKFITNYTVPEGMLSINIPIDNFANEIQEVHLVYKNKKRINMCIKSLMLREVC